MAKEEEERKKQNREKVASYRKGVEKKSKQLEEKAQEGDQYANTAIKIVANIKARLDKGLGKGTMDNEERAF